jgi:dTDP-4-amino-4,6-dideoxygalactose transaminase
MAKKTEIGYFIPPKFKKQPFDFKGLDEMCGKHFMYASKGRWCLYHILKSLKVKGPVLLPAYCCSTVLEPLEALHLEYHFYDILPHTLNADLNSVKMQVDKVNPDCVIAVSMYGNPCQLTELEHYCKEKGIALVDDAAQSFGAKQNGRFVGTFGDAGFFAFSPGKPFSGHMGGLFWTKEVYSVSYIHHPIFHRITYKNFCVNRMGWIHNHDRLIPGILKKITDYLSRKIDIKNDGCEKFENEILGGIYYDSFHGHTPLRTQLSKRLKKELVGTQVFLQVYPDTDNNNEGIAHKYVFVCETRTAADELLCYLKEYGIAAQKGYKLLTSDLTNLPGSRQIDGCVVEIPLDPNEQAHEYVVKVINNYIKKI